MSKLNQEHHKDDDGMTIDQVIDISEKSLDYVWTKLFEGEKDIKQIPLDEMLKLVTLAKMSWEMSIQAINFDLATSDLEDLEDEKDEDEDLNDDEDID